MADVDAADMVQAQAPGYRIDIANERLDLRRFERATARGRAPAAGRPADGHILLRSALAHQRADAADGVQFGLLRTVRGHARELLDADAAATRARRDDHFAQRRVRAQRLGPGRFVRSTLGRGRRPRRHRR